MLLQYHTHHTPQLLQRGTIRSEETQQRTTGGLKGHHAWRGGGGPSRIPSAQLCNKCQLQRLYTTDVYYTVLYVVSNDDVYVCTLSHTRPIRDPYMYDVIS